jgi:hypothetical protein
VIEILPGFIEIVLLIFCLIDCIQSDSLLVRNLPKIAWILLIIILPLVGGIAWLVAGRPLRAGQTSSVPWRATQTSGFPEYERSTATSRSLDEVDERLRRDQERVDREHEDALRRWEASLRDRERKLESSGGADATTPPDSSGGPDGAEGYGTPEPR